MNWQELTWDEQCITRRASNVLRNEGLKTLGQVAAMTDSQLLRMPNFGRVSLEEVRSIIEECGGCRISTMTTKQTVGDRVVYAKDMTLADHFAAQALAGFLANSKFDAKSEDTVVADACYQLATAMMAKRKKDVK